MMEDMAYLTIMPCPGDMQQSGKKGHLERNCKVQVGQRDYQGGTRQKTAYQNGTVRHRPAYQRADDRRQTAYHYQYGRTQRTRNQAPKVIQQWIKKSDLHDLYVLSTNHGGSNKIWVLK